MRNHLPVLTYHSLDQTGSVISTPPARFRQQMEALRARGWHTLRLDELLAGCAHGFWPARTFVLTFDDGFKSFGEHALPVLSACGFSAILSVVAMWVGRTNDWPGQPRGLPRLPLMDWAELRGAVGAGMEIAGHSLSHEHLALLGEWQAGMEISDCKHAIEDRIGCPVRSFTYPYGEVTPALEQMVAMHYRAGFRTRLARVTPASRMMALDRIDAYYLREVALPTALDAGWLDAYLGARRWLKMLRAVTVRPAPFAGTARPSPAPQSRKGTRSPLVALDGSTPQGGALAALDATGRISVEEEGAP